MLDVQTEIRKGILFIRLSGQLNKNTINILNHEVTDLIKDNGISNVVFNLETLDEIDIKGINTLYYNYELITRNQGKSMICNLNNKQVRNCINKNRLLNYMTEISDELSALTYVNL